MHWGPGERDYRVGAGNGGGGGAYAPAIELSREREKVGFRTPRRPLQGLGAAEVVARRVAAASARRTVSTQR